MFAVDVCDLPATGGSTFVLVAGLFVLVAGVIVTRWVRASAGRLSVVVAPLVLLGGLV
jgi:LPXTG-motif cell wall-anchored protein